jgi:hypothetical protein
METSIGIPEENYYNYLHEIGGTGLLPQSMETGPDRGAAEIRETGLLSAWSIPTYLATEYAGKDIRNYHGPKIVFLG